MNNVAVDRMKEMLGLMLIGDGVLAAAWPEEHSLLWLSGPEAWRETVRPFAEYPNVTRFLGVAEVAFGLWLARKSMQARGDDEDPVAVLPSL